MRRALPLVVFLIASGARVLPGPRTIDDAFITFRYARNLLSGHGFVYNPQEPVLGTTTPLYTLTLASLGLLAGQEKAPFPLLSMAFNAVADGLTCLLLLQLGTRLGSRRAGWGAALVWAVAPYSVTFAIGGLETSLYVLLLTATFSAYLAARFTAAALLGALALLTRPDALLLIGPLALDRLLAARKARHPPLRRAEIFAFGLPLAAWAAFATTHFGSPIPNSVLAKSLAYRLPPEAAFVRLLQHYATPFLGHQTFGIPWIGVGMFLYPFLFLSGARRAYRASARTWPFLLFPWLYFAAFALANPLIFRWYLTPPLPPYFLGILLGADRLLTEIAARWAAAQGGRGQPWRARAVGALPIAFVLLAPTALSLRDWTPRPDHGLNRPAPQMAWYRLELLYREAAESLNPYLEEETTLAASDVGVLGYYTSARILDTVGLNSPQALKYYPLDPHLYVINLATPPDLILDTQPDYVVLLEVYGRAGLFKDPRFWEDYGLHAKIPTDIYGSDGMLIFAHKRVP